MSAVMLREGFEALQLAAYAQRRLRADRDVQIGRVVRDHLLEQGVDGECVLRHGSPSNELSAARRGSLNASFRPLCPVGNGGDANRQEPCVRRAASDVIGVVGRDAENRHGVAPDRDSDDRPRARLQLDGASSRAFRLERHMPCSEGAREREDDPVVPRRESAPRPDLERDDRGRPPVEADPRRQRADVGSRGSR